MQPKTDFHIRFEFNPSPEYKNQLQAFIDKTVDSYTGDYLPPDVWFRDCSDILSTLRNEYKKKIQGTPRKSRTALGEW